MTRHGSRQLVGAVLIGLTVLSGCGTRTERPATATDAATTAAAAATDGIGSAAGSADGTAAVPGQVDRAEPDSTGLALARAAALWDTRTDTGPADAVLRAGNLVGASLLAEYASNRTERPPLSWREPATHGAHLKVDVTPGAATDYEGQLVPDGPTTVWRTYTVSATWIGDDGWTSDPIPLTIRTQLRKTENQWTAAQLTIQETT